MNGREAWAIKIIKTTVAQLNKKHKQKANLKKKKYKIQMKIGKKNNKKMRKQGKMGKEIRENCSFHLTFSRE